MYKVCDNSRLSQRLNKRSVFRLLVTICSWKQFFFSMAYEVFLGFPQANEMVLWRNDYYEGFIIEPYTLRSIKFLEVILPPPTSLILTLWKLRQRDVSALPKTIQLMASSRARSSNYYSSIYSLIFHSLISSFIQYIYVGQLLFARDSARCWGTHTYVVAQLYLTLCNLVDCSTPGSSVHGILQATVLEWVAISCIAGRFFTTKPQGKHRCWG